MRSVLILIVSIISLSISSYSQELNQVDDMDRKQGKWLKTYVNGVTKYDGQFRNDKPYGTFTYYYENGEKKAITSFSDDGIIAYTNIFHQNGKPLADGKYINQLRDSTWNFYSDIDGKLIASENYKQGKLNGKSILYYADTNKEAEVTEYKNDIKDGIYLKYFPDGKLMTEGFYRNGQFHGEFVVYHENGTFEIKGRYNNGLKEGNWDYYNESGQEITEEQYKEETP